MEFFGPHEKVLEDPGIGPLSAGHVELIETYGPNGTVQNYRLTHYEQDSDYSIKYAVEQDDVKRLTNNWLGKLGGSGDPSLAVRFFVGL